MISALLPGSVPRRSFPVPSPVLHLGHRRIRRAARGVVLASLICASGVSPAAAQSSTATIEVRVDSDRLAASAADAPLPVQLLSVRDPSRAWNAHMRSGESVRFRLVPPGRYRLISGSVERH